MVDRLTLQHFAAQISAFVGSRRQLANCISSGRISSAIPVAVELVHTENQAQGRFAHDI